MTVPENIDALGMAHRNVFVAALLLLICLLFLCLVRAIKGPRVSDRIVAVNMMGTMVMVIIAVMALLLHEGYLVDICLIYAMISFLAVIVLTKVYMGVYRQRKLREMRTDAEQTEVARPDMVQGKELGTDVEPEQAEEVLADVAQGEELQADVGQSEVARADVVQEEELRTDVKPGQAEMAQPDATQSKELRTYIKRAAASGVSDGSNGTIAAAGKGGDVNA